MLPLVGHSVCYGKAYFKLYILMDVIACRTKLPVFVALYVFLLELIYRVSSRKINDITSLRILGSKF